MAGRHPRDMGASEVEAFLTHLANDRKVSASTLHQALSAILFLYREVLAIELPWLNGISPTAHSQRIDQRRGGGVVGADERRNRADRPIALQHWHAFDGG